MLKKYKCIFFDLDHTLWDYDTNSRETLYDLYHEYELEAKGVLVFDLFFDQFRTVNLSLWDQYDRGLITNDVIRKERFRQILEPFNAFEETLCAKLSDHYLDACPLKNTLMPKALEVLKYLHQEYDLTIITNGFDEIQHKKIKAGKLESFFDHVVTSQRAGSRKPSREIFEYALKVNNVKAHEAIMVGDNPVADIGGAMNASIDAVLFNPLRLAHEVKPHYEISELEELRQFL